MTNNDIEAYGNPLMCAMAEIGDPGGPTPKTVEMFRFAVSSTDEQVLVDGYKHVPELGSVLVIRAVPPKLQLFGIGLVW